MSILVMLAAQPAEGSPMRIFLFVVLIVAVLLILAGCVIAIFTLYSLQKSRQAESNTLHPWE